MSFELQRLQEARGRAATQMHDMLGTAETEDRGFTSDEDQTWANLEQEISDLDARIARCTRANALELELESRAPEEREDEPGRIISPEQHHADCFGRFIRLQEWTPEQRTFMAEHRAQAVGTDAAGGYTVPEGFQNSVESAMLAYGGIQNRATVIHTATGNDLPFPTDDDTSNSGALLAENTQDSEQDVVFGSTLLEAYKYTSKIVRVSVELLQDSAFNLDAYLAGKLGERLGRITAAHYATGTGTAQPNGLATAATVGKTAASATAFTYDELLDLKHSVDPAYRRQGAAWIFNDTTLLAAKKLKDSQNRPLWLPNIREGEPSTLDGDPFEVDQGMASAASTTKPIAYGAISKYHIRIVRDMSLVRMVERYADYHQVGFVMFMRADADLMDAGTNPVKVLQMAA